MDSGFKYRTLLEILTLDIWTCSQLQITTGVDSSAILGNISLFLFWKHVREWLQLLGESHYYYG